MFASHTTATVPLTEPDGTVNVVTVKKLNWHRLEEAGEKQAERAMQKAAKAGAEVLTLWERQAEREDKRRKAGIEAPEKTSEELRQERYAAYDKETVLLYGVTKWTSSVELAQGLADLDEEAADTLHRKILDMSLPPLTKTEVAALKGEG